MYSPESGNSVTIVERCQGLTGPAQQLDLLPLSFEEWPNRIVHRIEFFLSRARRIR